MRDVEPHGMIPVSEGLDAAKRSGTRVGPGMYIRDGKAFVDALEFATEIGIQDLPNWKQIVARAFEKNYPDMPRTEVYE